MEEFCALALELGEDNSIDGPYYDAFRKQVISI